MELHLRLREELFQRPLTKQSLLHLKFVEVWNTQLICIELDNLAVVDYALNDVDLHVLYVRPVFVLSVGFEEL
jgi:hypothetical protein